LTIDEWPFIYGATALILQNRFLISALLDKKVVSLHWILKSNEF